MEALAASAIPRTPALLYKVVLVSKPWPQTWPRRAASAPWSSDEQRRLLRSRPRRRRAAHASLRGTARRVFAPADLARSVPVRSRAHRRGVPPLRSTNGAARHERRSLRRHPESSQARVHPPRRVEATGSRAARRSRLRRRRNVLRRPTDAQLDQRRLSHDRHRLRLASAPRYLVLGASMPAQLVAPDLRASFGQRDGLPPALLHGARREHVGQL